VGSDNVEWSDNVDITGIIWPLLSDLNTIGRVPHAGVSTSVCMRVLYTGETPSPVVNPWLWDEDHVYRAVYVCMLWDHPLSASRVRQYVSMGLSTECVYYGTLRVTWTD
jgi:hypothetical protein